MPVQWRERGKKSDRARKKKRRSAAVSAPQKSPPPPPIPTPPSFPYPINDKKGFLLSTSSANERAVPGNTAVELHRLWCLSWFQCVRTMLICVSVSSVWSENTSAAPGGKETLCLRLSAAWTERWIWLLPVLGGGWGWGGWFEMSFESGTIQSADC